MGAMLPGADPAVTTQLESLRRIALAVARPVDDAFVADLIAELADAMPATTAFVATFTDDTRTRLRTLAARFEGRSLPDFDYAVAGSPCEQVVGRDFRYIARGVLAQIDPQSVFAAAGMDAYAAFPLEDSQGTPLGVLAVMDRAPLVGGDAAHAEVMLKIVAGRLASELERRRTLAVVQQAALAVSAAQGEAVFDELVRALAALLGLEFAFIARHDADEPEMLKLLALHADGRLIHDLSYPLASSPCRHVLGQQFRAFASGLAHLFPDDPDVLVKGAEGYAGHPLTGHDGEALGVVAVGSRQPLRDLDRIESLLKIFAVRAGAEIERLRAHEALRRSEAGYRTVFDNAQTAIFVHDWDRLTLIDANRRACQDHGRTLDDLLAVDPSELMGGDPPYDLPHALEHLERAKLGRCPPFEWQFRVKTGEKRWFEVHLKPAQIDGRPCILAFSHDITERKAAEEQLRASEEQHRSIFNASIDPQLVKDAEHRIVDLNEAFLHMVGFERDEMLGHRLSEFVPAELQARCDVLVPEILAGQPCQLEATMLRRDGSGLEVEIRGAPVQYRGRTLALVIMRDITERKATEARLRASEAQYRAIFDASADALMLWDRQMQRVDVNAAHERIFGFAREDVVGRAFEGLPYPDEDARPRLEMVRRALDGEACRAELEAIRKDGSRILTELRTIPFVHRGEPHVLQIARDITERKAAEARLRASEAQYRAIFNASADALLLWDSQMRRVDVNDAYERMYGWARAEVIGKAYEHLPQSAEYVAPRQALVRRALAGEACHAELEAIRKDGRRILTEVHAVPFTHRGEPHVLAIARDITARKQAELQLRAQQERYRAIFDGSVDPMVLWNERLEVSDVNRAFEQVTGYSRAQMIGRHWSERGDASDMEQLLPLVRAALAGQPSHTVQRVTHADGHAFEMEIRYLPVSLGDEAHALGVGRDITERTQLEAQLRQAQKMEAIGQLTGGIAHDFNNILTSVLGYTALAQERAEALADTRLQRQLGQARLATERARDLVAQMLAFARRKPGARRPVALTPIVRQAVGLLRPTLPASLIIEVDAGDDLLPHVEADPVQLEQVLFNLCINARDAVAGAGRIRVGLGASAGGWRCRSCGLPAPRGHWVTLTVEDDGSGIAEDTMRRMFDPFFSTKPAGSGSGMGLAMVHGIVHDHGGHIGVRSTLGEATRFEVLLPACAGAPAAPLPPEGATDAAGAAPALRGHVLLVEDDALAGDYLAEQLTAWGLEVTLQRDPRAALAWFEDASHAVDLLLTDLTMPHLSGLDLARLARRARPGLAVLLVSGDLGVTDARALADAGVRATLSKPLDAARLRAALLGALDAAG